MNIAIFGGSFDPAHLGHLKMIEFAKLHAQRIIVVPSFISPFKPQGAVAPPQVRLSLARATFKDCEISDYEISRGQSVRTYETLQHFKKQYKADKIMFLIGSDSLLTLHEWAMPQILGEFCFLVMQRPHFIQSTKQRADEFVQKYGGEFIFSEQVGEDISSSLLRLLICLNRAQQYMDACAYQQVRQGGYYDEFEAYVRALDMFKLEDERKEHIIQVAICASKLAAVYGENQHNAITAALLHDLAKRLSFEDAVALGLNPPKSILQIAAPIRHAKIGALLAKKEFGIYNEDILNAIEFHTTARANMSLLEKIIFISDLIEPLRELEFEQVGQLRELAFRDLDAAIVRSLKIKIDFAKQKAKTLDTTSIEALEYYSKE